MNITVTLFNEDIEFDIPDEMYKKAEETAKHLKTPVEKIIATAIMEFIKREGEDENEDELE